jgi:hypothetical protein
MGKEGGSKVVFARRTSILRGPCVRLYRYGHFLTPLAQVVSAKKGKEE